MPLFRISTLLLLLSLYGCNQPEHDSAIKVAESFWHAVQDGEKSTALEYTSSTSQEQVARYLDQPDNTRLPVEQVNSEIPQTISKTIINIADTQPQQTIEINTFLVLEGGHWKVDANQTELPSTQNDEPANLEDLSRKLSRTMQKTFDSLGEIMTENMESMNKAMREGAEDVGESMIENMEEINRRMRETLEKMKREKQQREQQEERVL